VDEEVAKNREKDSLLVQQDRQAAMGEMIGNIAHQWRQPLNAVSVIVQDLAIRADSDELTREHLEESASRVVELTKHMSQTINDFRDFFRPDKEMVTFSLREVIWKSLTLVEGSFREQCISLEVSAEEDVLGVGYPNQFAQVVLNILNNSRDALVERKAPNPRIVIEVSRRCERSLVTIRDNAGGIPADIIHRVFDPYFTTKKEGTGIGLFMSRHIIERNMSGTLTVRNEEEGAAFSLVL
jgi:signal transduction histidine kinase